MNKHAIFALVLAAFFGVFVVYECVTIGRYNDRASQSLHYAPSTEQLETARAGLTRAYVTVRCNVVASVTLWYPDGDSVTVTERSPPQAIAGVNRIVSAIPGDNVRYFNAGCPQ